MNKYAVAFSKNGYIKYTSHLDMLRLFKRAFRRSGIDLAYSRGYNPHPRMGFAQPLSLGYSADFEILEFDSDENCDPKELKERIHGLPEGIRILSAARLPSGRKSLAACCRSAVYDVRFPIPFYQKDYPKVVQDFLSLDEIMALKRQKKTKKLREVDIRSKIRRIRAVPDEQNRLVLELELDCGSQSNLSPELVIQAFTKYDGEDTPRYEIEVRRKSLGFDLDYRIEWM